MANFRPGATVNGFDLARFQQLILPPAIGAVRDGCNVVTTEAQSLAPKRSGRLAAGIRTGSVEVRGTVVEGFVESTAPHASFVEYGTGLVGKANPHPELPTAGVPFTGAWIYDYKNQNWIGQAAQPYMRPALDVSGPKILEAFRARGFKV